MYSSIQSIDNLIETNALVEQHIHGGFGIDFSKCGIDDFINFSKKIVKYGVSAFFPTLATDSVENLIIQINRIKEAQACQADFKMPMAKILGVHLEACFLNPLKKGIHNEKQLLKPTIENYKLLEDDIIKIVTLAPELDDGFELCQYLADKGVKVSAGHCVGADLSHVHQVTHLYNAMGEFSHRSPSTVVSALSSNVYTELIADGKHVQNDVLKITFRTKPLSKIILISDALPIAHSSLESMEFCGKTVFLKDKKAVDANGTMAGSTDFVCDIVKKLVKENLLDFETAISMASSNLNYCNIEKPDVKVLWDKNMNISAMVFGGEFVMF